MIGTERLPLTNRQAEILTFIRGHVRDQGYPPTIREIGHEFGIKSPNGVTCHLKFLAKKGYIAVSGTTARGIRLIDGNEIPETHKQKVARLRREAAEAVARWKAAVAEGGDE